MQFLQTHTDILSKYFSFSNKTVVDIGCGTGDLVRWLAEQGARVTGIDTKALLEKAALTPKIGNENYREGVAEILPFENSYADIILYCASFHHIPREKMADALRECKRVLKPSGHAILIEPVAEKGSYYEVVHLIEDESEIQAHAYGILRTADRLGFRPKAQEFYFLERSFTDYVNLLSVFVDDDKKRADTLSRARIVTEELCKKTGKQFDEFRYRSICRLNILQNSD